MCLAIHAEVMDNSRYGAHKLNPGPPFFHCYKEP